ncbi:MAG: phosphoribosylamine--glycine ligase [Deltaproteobacteria bacterium]|nr:MAG: phosphoribosylamine--glycine ligase [Deltaproteobacteria bacterium]
MANVLVLGSGGREHALGWKLAQSDHVTEVIYAPGNGGTEHGKGRNVPLNANNKDDWPALLRLIEEESIALTVVGPEAPLSAGLVDHFHSQGVQRIFGPSQFAAQLESDKFFSYRILDKLGIPQAQSACCSTADEAKAAIHELLNERGIVLKARGLAGGKGVIVCKTAAEAEEAAATLQAQYGDDLLVCERLEGPEFSVFGIADGKSIKAIELALQDHKRRDNNDQGPNTGGMGAYGPAPIAPPEVIQQVHASVMTPVIEEMNAQGNPFQGFLYAGFMYTEEGPKVLEFNVRFGDPECQPAMTLLASDLYEVLDQTLSGNLGQMKLSFHPGAACCVVLASNGYPGPITKGLTIQGLEKAGALEGVEVFHAGTVQQDGVLKTSGGRVLGVTGYSDSGLAEAQQRAYDAIQHISVEGNFHYRTDIAARALP